MPALFYIDPWLFLTYIPGMIFFLRFLMEYSGADYYNPFSRFVALVTRPFLKLFRNVRAGGVNIAALLNMVLLSYAILIVRMVVPGGFYASDLPALFLFNLVFTVWMIIEVLILLLLVSAVLSWIPAAIAWSRYFAVLLRPLTAVFDKYIPSIGMISLSFIVVFLLLEFVDHTVMPRVLFLAMKAAAGWGGGPQ